MFLVKQTEQNSEGQGLVEYGLILALVSIVAIGSLGNIGDRVSSTFNKVTQPVFSERLYSEDDIDRLVDVENYIPITSSDELDNIRKKRHQVLGEGTKWSGEYYTGLDKNYILISDISLEGIGS